LYARTVFFIEQVHFPRCSCLNYKVFSFSGKFFHRAGASRRRGFEKAFQPTMKSKTVNPVNWQDEKFIRMTTAPVERLVCGLAVPGIVINLISGLYNMADTYFVSSLGTSAAGAVGIAYPLMSIIQALGFFFGQGTGNFISRALGARQNREAQKMAATGFFSALLIIAALARFLGATETIVP
jgi:hypothetical protein